MSMILDMEIHLSVFVKKNFLYVFMKSIERYFVFELVKLKKKKHF